MPSRKLTTVLTAGLAACLLLAAGCSSGASMKRVDPKADDDVGGTGIDSADLIAATDQAAVQLKGVLLSFPGDNLIIAPSTIKNESSQPFNTALITDRLVDKLVSATAPRVSFLAREHLDEVMKEREAKRKGVYAPTEEKALPGAHYLLTGRINSLGKRYKGERADYFQLNLRLVDAEDSRIVWTKGFEFKKSGTAGVIYQ